MASTYSKITVVPPVADGVGVVPVAVSIKAPNGLTATAYTSRDGSTAFTFPATITVETTFYLTSAGDHEVSAIAGAQQVATQAGKPAQVYAPNSSTDVVVRCVDPVDNADSLAETIATDTAFTSQIVSLAQGVQGTGNRTVFLGDSITRGGQGTSEAALDDDRFRSASIPTWASILSGQRILEVAMAGVGGDAVADMLDRFATDVTPFAPNVVVIMGGTNDTNSLHLTSLTDYAATMADLVTEVRKIGARPVLCTIAPHRGEDRKSVV